MPICSRSTHPSTHEGVNVQTRNLKQSKGLNSRKLLSFKPELIGKYWAGGKPPQAKEDPWLYDILVHIRKRGGGGGGAEVTVQCLLLRAMLTKEGEKYVDDQEERQASASRET